MDPQGMGMGMSTWLPHMGKVAQWGRFQFKNNDNLVSVQTSSSLLLIEDKHYLSLFLSRIDLLKIRTLYAHDDEHKDPKYYKAKLRELWNSKTEVQWLKPKTTQTRCKLKRISTDQWISPYSEVREFRSFHTSHIKQDGTKFQTATEFPDQ